MPSVPWSSSPPGRGVVTTDPRIDAAAKALYNEWHDGDRVQTLAHKPAVEPCTVCANDASLALAAADDCDPLRDGYEYVLAALRAENERLHIENAGLRADRDDTMRLREQVSAERDRYREALERINQLQVSKPVTTMNLAGQLQRIAIAALYPSEEP